MSELWIWGRHPVLEALRAGTARTIVVAKGRAPSRVIDEIRNEARRRGVPCQDVPERRLDELAPGQNTQGVAAQTQSIQRGNLEELIAGTKSDDHPAFLVVLDQIQDPHNFGALLRTADAAGVGGVIVPQRRSAPLSGVVAKTSAGAMSYITTVEVPNLVRALDELRDAGLWTVGLTEDAPQLIYEVDLTVPLALVVGSEGTGLRRLTRDHCELSVRLPMLGHVDSLNASVAGAVAMYEVVRQRQERKRRAPNGPIHAFGTVRTGKDDQ